MVTIAVELKPYGHIRAACFERIADSPAPLPVRQDYMLRVVKMLARDRCPQPFVSLVNADVLEPLRKIAFEGPLGPKGYNSAALELLAEYGDLQTVERVRGWATERGEDPSSLGRVGGYIWMIESQHKPSMLLDHIRSNQWVNHQTRPWALRRAIQLGVSHADLRGAILDHARGVDKDERLRTDIVVLKRIALENGVITADDLSGFDER